jgi:hypothetical protein
MGDMADLAHEYEIDQCFARSAQCEAARILATRTWTTRVGEKIPFEKLKQEHLGNIIAMLRAHEYAALYAEVVAELEKLYLPSRLI